MGGEAGTGRQAGNFCEPGSGPQADSEASAASIVEIFSGIQGEGVFVGLRQLFVRFALCNLSCTYCDTQHSWKEPDFAVCESLAGSRTFDSHPNPLPIDNLLALVGRFDPAAHHSLVLTGGEPLVSAGFLQQALPRLRQAGWKLFLETNGTLGGALAKVAPHIDYVSLDIKLPVSAEAVDFLAAAAAARDEFGCELQAKIVVAADTAADDLLAAVSAAASHAIPVTLQPVTPPSGSATFSAANLAPSVSPTPSAALPPSAAPPSAAASMTSGAAPHSAPLPPSADRLLELQAAALSLAPDVRVIPQVHKLMGQM